MRAVGGQLARLVAISWCASDDFLPVGLFTGTLAAHTLTPLTLYLLTWLSDSMDRTRHPSLGAFHCHLCG